MSPTATKLDAAPVRHTDAARERRVCRTFDSRGTPGLGEALRKLDGTVVSGRFRIDSLYAAGGEGAVFLATDLTNAGARRVVAKVPLVPYHKGVELSSNFLRRRRESLREEARNLDASASRFMPISLGLHEFANPLLDRARGGEFASSEPVIVMEWLPGFDLDHWLARIHRSDVPVALLRKNLDRVAVVLLNALVDLQEHGFYYADLRPGNLRMMGRPERRVRLLDAGSLVEIGDESGKFPHVPAYLPPDLFTWKQETGRTIVPSAAIQAVMAGRTLFEVATGIVPMPGQAVDRTALKESHVSQPVADVVDGLATGSFEDVRQALKYLSKRAVKRVSLPAMTGRPNAGVPGGRGAAPTASASVPVIAEETPTPVTSRPEREPEIEAIAPEPLQIAATQPAAASAPRDPAAPAAAGPSEAESAAPLTKTQIIPSPAGARPWWKRLLGIR